LLERHVVEAGEIPSHEHLDFCLHLQTRGDAGFEWWSQGKNAIEKTAPGSMILVSPGTCDRLHWRGRSERLILSIQSDWLGGLALEAGARSLSEFQTKWTFEDPVLKNLMQEMGRQAEQDWPLGGLYADLLAMSLGSQLLRRHAVDPLSPQEAKGGLTTQKLRLALEYINEHLDEDLKVEDIAGVIGQSPFHFAHAFRNHTGYTPYQYLVDQRMTRAQQLLKTTNFPVQDIASLTGFRSAVNFVRAFRQRVGVTPGEWRKGS
jgi:AraC family transcriptional regulator